MSPVLLALLCSPLPAINRVAPTPAYLDPTKPPRARALDLVSRMTLDEKISQMMHQAAAIPRLNIPAYNWWSEALHGIAKPGNVTVFPQVIGLGATFDPDLVHQMAVAISDEGRARYNYQNVHGDQGWDQGLDFWAPNINIFRDPRWGRGQETYGEDPFLTGRMAVAYISGIQGNDPKHLKAIATPKHYAVHSGPDPLRHQFDVQVSPQEMWMTYLPAFQAAITEADAWSIMSSYNSVNGMPSSGNTYLLKTVLRDRWGFNGYVVSDCGAIDDILYGHKVVKTKEEAAALAVNTGCDLECGNSYQALKGAVSQGLITEKTIDVSLERLMEARVRMGMFDQKTQYDAISMDVVDSDAHRALARKLADESIVLLKNSANLLPLKKDLKEIAVIGPNAVNLSALYGNYNGTNKKLVTMLQGIKEAVGPNTKVTYARGSGITGLADYQAVPASALSLKAEYFANQTLSGTPIVTRTEAAVDNDWAFTGPADGVPQEHWSARWTGTLTAPETGDYGLTITCDDGMRVWIDGVMVLDDWHDGPARTRLATKHLMAGQKYALKVEFYNNTLQAVAKFGWQPPTAHPFDEAIAAAKSANVIILALGIDPDQEGEEHDRADIGLPNAQIQLLQALQALNKPIVVVYQNGGPISSEDVANTVPAIVEAWYPGEEGGHAIADALFGDYNPAGRLPVTIVRHQADLPDFADYHMDKGRTYRWPVKAPEFGFGYGLSYTTFAYSDLALPHQIRAGKPLVATVMVKNTGEREGDEVVQLYLSNRTSTSAPLAQIRPKLELKGIKRIHLKPGESRKVVLEVPVSELAMADAETKFVVEPGTVEVSIGGSQPTASGANGVSGTVTITGAPVVLPFPKAKS